MTPKLAVIIPVYNTAKYLRKCLDSVLNQSYEDIEIIIVDDGSTDGSGEICDAYERLDSRIKVIHQNNKGCNKSRKEAVLQVDSDYITFVDSDDWIEKDMYVEMMKIATVHQPDLITSVTVCEYQNLRKSINMADCFDEGLYTNLYRDIYPYMLWDFRRDYYGMYPSVCNKIFKKNLLKHILSQIDENVFYGEDALLLYSYCMKANSIYITKQAHYHYRIHSESICHKNDVALLENSWRLYQGLLEAFRFLPCEKNLIQQLRRYILEINGHTLRMVFNINPSAYYGWQFACDHLLESRVVLYGAGICGQAFYQYALQNDKQDNIIAWVDQAGELKNQECLHEIKQPESIVDMEYDHVIIAVSDLEVKNEIVKMLCEEYCIDPELVHWENGMQ